MRSPSKSSTICATFNQWPVFLFQYPPPVLFISGCFHILWLLRCQRKRAVIINSSSTFIFKGVFLHIQGCFNSDKNSPVILLKGLKYYNFKNKTEVKRTGVVLCCCCFLVSGWNCAGNSCFLTSCSETRPGDLYRGSYCWLEWPTLAASSVHLQEPNSPKSNTALHTFNLTLDFCFSSFFSIEKVSKITSPVLIIHGTEDEVIDFSHGLALFERCPKAVEPLWVEGAGHNDIELYSQYLDRLRRFIGQEVAAHHVWAAPTPGLQHRRRGTVARLTFRRDPLFDLDVMEGGFWWRYGRPSQILYSQC